ncbi:MAG: response regulator transcription factor [Desulfobulbaceae bacterium]|nr:response regulator transcription factor [Desulfobulbaceae bacterium]
MKDHTTLLIIDDHPLFREGLKSIMKFAPRFEIIGEANDGLTGLTLATELKPDIILTNISMLGIDGIELTRRLKTLLPESKVVILSTHSGLTHISLAMHAGASGYLLKSSSPAKVLEGITAVANNQTFMDRISSQSISSETLSIKVLEHYETQRAYENLTPREQQVMRGLVEETTHQQLAEKLSITTKTVENHRSNIMRKLALKREIELIRFAAQIGLIKTNT